MSTVRPDHIRRFGVFEVDLEAGQLRKKGLRVRLQEQPFRVLALLLDRPGRVVTREELQEKVWPETHVDFEKGLNTAIQKIRQALGDTAANPRFVETLPGRGYRFLGPVEGSQDADKAGPTQARGTKGLYVALGVAIPAVLALIAVWVMGSRSPEPAIEPRITPLTSDLGTERHPTFSPDGSQIAYSWDGEAQDNFDIYIHAIGTTSRLRLTRDPATDHNPVWSPDGKTIAFLRRSGEDIDSVMLMPVLGGRERHLADITSPYAYRPPQLISWTPDGQWLIVPDRTAADRPWALFAVPKDGGERRRLTDPGPGLYGDHLGVVSPDGRSLVIARSEGYIQGDMYRVALGEGYEGYQPRGQPERLTFQNHVPNSLAWGPGGREVFLGTAGGLLARVELSKPVTTTPLAFGREESEYLVVSPSGSALAYARRDRTMNIWRIELAGPGRAAGPPSRLIASTAHENNADYSPDGRQIAFQSSRQLGLGGIWLCDADGSNVGPLFDSGARMFGTGVPRWSPDGRLIAFDRTYEGVRNVWVISAEGGKPLRLTDDSTTDMTPNWSRDGEWVYFASNRTGRYETWKVAPGDGEAVQVTREGGSYALESIDGKQLYYAKGFGEAGLWRMPVAGGKEERLVESLHFLMNFTVVEDGIYFVLRLRPADRRGDRIQFFRFSDRSVTTVHEMDSRHSMGLSVSPDRRFLLFNQVDIEGSDLMLVEGFE